MVVWEKKSPYFKILAKMKYSESSKFGKWEKLYSCLVLFLSLSLFFNASTLREWLSEIISCAQATVDNNTTQHKNDSNPDEEGVNKNMTSACKSILLFSSFSVQYWLRLWNWPEQYKMKLKREYLWLLPFNKWHPSIFIFLRP